MKAILALATTLLFSTNAMALAMKTYKGQDDHGKQCGLQIGFEEGKIVSIMIQALGDKVGEKKPVPVWTIMMKGEEMWKLLKPSGSFKSGKMYFEAKEAMDLGKIKLERKMGLAINLKRGTLNFENHNNAIKENILTSCVGLKEAKEDDPPDAENDPCDIEENAAMRNMCKVEAGKKKGTIPEGAVASPMPSGETPETKK